MIQKKLFSPKSLVGSSSIYLFTSILNASIPFFLIPIITRYLSPAEFGVYSMFKVIAGIMFSIIGLGINGSITKVYFDKNKEEIKSYIGNSIILVTVNSILIYVVFSLIPNLLSSVTAIPSNWLWTVIIASYGKVLFQVFLVLYQVQNKPLSFGVFQITQSSVNFIVSVFFVVSLSMNWKGVILAETLAFFLFGIIGLYVLFKRNWISFKFNKKDVFHILMFGGPTLPHVIGMYIITASDRFLITNLIGIKETGIYAAGYQIAMIIMILQDSFNKAWVPWLFSKLKANNEIDKIRIVKITYFYFFIILIIVLCLSIISPLIVRFFIGPGYEMAEGIIIWLAIGYAFNGMYKMVTNYIFYVEKTIYLAIITFFTSIINLLLSYIFIIYNGLVGAAQATAVSYLISFIFTWILSNKLYKMPWGNILRNRK